MQYVRPSYDDMAVKLKIRATESLKLVATKSDFNACYIYAMEKATCLYKVVSRLL